MRYFFSIVALCLCGLNLMAETDPRYYAVEVSAQTRTSPAQITLSWTADGNATGYTVQRKAPGETSWSSGVSLPAGAASYVDSQVQTGVAYEYQVSKSTSIGYRGYGYVLAAIEAPLVEYRGKVILVVDSTYASDLAGELNRLQQDLAGDGWTVLRHDVSRSTPVAAVKALILADYAADPGNVKSVFLFGHVPVPYSGNFNPDGHYDHVGAWPADAFYGDVDGVWTDATVYNVSANKEWNHNVPGDGKYDQSYLPSDVDLEVGRVDLANMTCYANKEVSRSEKDLLLQYLNKDHNFRTRAFSLERRGVVSDNFGEHGGEAFAASGWRNFAPFFGGGTTTPIAGGTFFTTLNNDGYLWAYGTGGGAFYSCNGIGTSDDFTTNDIKAVFTMFVGSYFGDWDNESNFLRAPLGSTTYTLTASWSGRPHWFYHQMGLGGTIGASTRLSQNNNGQYLGQNTGTRGVHVALMGDPTLRMHPVAPPVRLAGQVSGSGVALSWTAPQETAVEGYYVYRAASAQGPFSRITPSPLSGTTFQDPTGTAAHVYQVKTLKLEQSGSGTYHNASQGSFFPSAAAGVPGPSVLTARAASPVEVNLTWADNSGGEASFKVHRQTASGDFLPLAEVPQGQTAFIDSSVAPGTRYTYRVCAASGGVDSAFSNPAIATTPVVTVSVPAGATYLGTDNATQGNWKSVYGTEGFQVLGQAAQLPGSIQLSPNNANYYEWQNTTTDARALLRYDGNSRVAACYYGESYTLDLNLADGKAHKVALYCLDWDRNGRVERIEFLDASSGAVLDSRTISGFQEGIYFRWEVKGAVQVRVTKQVGFNGAISGLFFDPAANTGASNGAILTPGVGGKPSQLRITGQPGQRFDIQATDNLRDWTVLSTITLTYTSLDFNDPDAASHPRRFYRAIAR